LKRAAEPDIEGAKVGRFLSAGTIYPSRVVAGGTPLAGPCSDDIRRLTFVKLIAGAILILAAEQAYAHANLIQFPNQGPAGQVLIPASGILLLLGLALTAWGLWPEKRSG
jgi:hypothetical protein